MRTSTIAMIAVALGSITLDASAASRSPSPVHSRTPRPGPVSVPRRTAPAMTASAGIRSAPSLGMLRSVTRPPTNSPPGQSLLSQQTLPTLPPGPDLAPMTIPPTLNPTIDTVPFTPPPLATPAPVTDPTQESTGGSPNSTAVVPNLGGGGTTLEECIASWVPELHLDKAYWRGLCQRTQHNVDQPAIRSGK